MNAILRPALCLLLLTPVCLADDVEVEPPASAKAQLRKMAGTYRVVHFEYAGQASTPQQLGTMKVILTKDGEGTFHRGNEVFQSKMVLSPTKRPSEIDSTYSNTDWKGKTGKGIYKLEKGVITFCYALPGGERPTKFETGPNTSLTLYKLERIEQK